MIWIVTIKEYATMEYAYVNLDGKNKLIVQVHNHEKANQTFNTIIILYYFNFSFAPDFYCLDDSHCNEKGACNIYLGNCACEEGWNGFLDCTFCKFRINVHFIKLISASPSFAQLAPVLSIFGTGI